MAATSFPSGVTRPSPVMATRRRLPCHPGPRETISIRPVATRFPSTIAARVSSAAPSVADRIAGFDLHRLTGENERAHLHIGHAGGPEPSAWRQRLPRELQRQPDLGVEQERGRKDGAPREVVAEKGRGYGDVHGRAQPLAGDVVDQREIRRRDTREAAGPCARSAERLEISPHRLRGIEVLQGQHRPHAPAQFQDRRVSDTRPPSVGDGVRIAALDLHAEVEDLPRRRLPDDSRLPGQGSHRSPPELGLGHGDPGGELSDRLGHEAGRERREVLRGWRSVPGPAVQLPAP